MSEVIQIKNVTKEFKVLNRHEGLRGSIRDLFSRDYKTVRAVDNITMSIGQGEIGEAALKNVITHPVLQNKPFILETPNDDEGYKKEIAMIRDWMV